MVSGCTTLLSEDLQDGLVIDGCRIVNPFRDADMAVHESGKDVEYEESMRRELARTPLGKSNGKYPKREELYDRHRAGKSGKK